MQPVDLARKSASSATAFHAEPLSHGRVSFGLIEPATAERADFVVVNASGLVAVEVKTAMGGVIPAVFRGVPQLVDYAVKARQRIAELRNAPNPWAEPTVVKSVEPEIPSVAVWLEKPTAVVSADAEAAAIAVFSRFTSQPPPSAVAIFPREDGGLRLQTVGEERTVIVDISAAGNEFAGEYAGGDVYHTERMRNAVDAARFIVNSTR